MAISAIWVADEKELPGFLIFTMQSDLAVKFPFSHIQYNNAPHAGPVLFVRSGWPDLESLHYSNVG
jgi:hypothetical protein